MSWRTYSQQALEWQYNPRVTVGNPQPFFERFQNDSTATREERPHQLEVRYGDGARETFDVFPADFADAPIHLFFHGGYWRSHDKRDYAFVARHLAPAGVSVVVAEYDLCPQVTVEAIVAAAIRCTRFVRDNARMLSGAAESLTVAGHSAGAQLVAKLMAHDWSAEEGIDNPIRAGVAISGVFDLEPLQYTSINDDIRLTAESARANSPLFAAPPPPGSCLWLLVGGEESDEFRRQSHEYADYCRGAGCEAACESVAGANHFSVLSALYGGDDALFGRLRRQLTDL